MRISSPLIPIGASKDPLWWTGGVHAQWLAPILLKHELPPKVPISRVMLPQRRNAFSGRAKLDFPYG